MQIIRAADIDEHYLILRGDRNFQENSILPNLDSEDGAKENPYQNINISKVGQELVVGSEIVEVGLRDGRPTHSLDDGIIQITSSKSLGPSSSKEDNRNNIIPGELGCELEHIPDGQTQIGIQSEGNKLNDLELAFSQIPRKNLKLHLGSYHVTETDFSNFISEMESIRNIDGSEEGFSKKSLGNLKKRGEKGVQSSDKSEKGEEDDEGSSVS